MRVGVLHAHCSASDSCKKCTDLARMHDRRLYLRCIAWCTRQIRDPPWSVGSSGIPFVSCWSVTRRQTASAYHTLDTRKLQNNSILQMTCSAIISSPRIYFRLCSPLFAVLNSSAKSTTRASCDVPRRCNNASKQSRLTSTRASAVNPAKARQTWSSSVCILRTVRGSCIFQRQMSVENAWWRGGLKRIQVGSRTLDMYLQLRCRLLLNAQNNDAITCIPLKNDFNFVLIHRCSLLDSIEASIPLTATAVVPFLTASTAYSTCPRREIKNHPCGTRKQSHLAIKREKFQTWNKCPSGEKTVMARS